MGKFLKFVFLTIILTSLVLPVILEAEENSAVFKDEILVIDNGFEYKLNILLPQKDSSSNTIEEILDKAKIEINEEDIIFPDREKPFIPGTKIIIERAIPVILNIYGKEDRIFTHKEKVLEVLDKEKIEFKDDDLIDVNLEAEIFPGLEIKIWKKLKPKPKITISQNSQRTTKNTAKTTNIQIGKATWYHFGANGDFCASNTFKRGTKLLVTNLENNCQVIVTVSGSGPFGSPQLIIDLEKSAFSKLASLSKGVIKIKVEKLGN